MILMTGQRYTRGYTGCINGVELQSSDTLDLGKSAISGINARPCAR